MNDVSFAVLGTGGIGRRTLEVSTHKEGLTPVAASDRNGVAFDPDGLDIEELLEATEGNIAGDVLAVENFAVVGTGTGVGKTVVTAGLVGAFREADVDACGVKPAQTGFPPDDDAGFVADACGSEEASTCLRRLEPALAPAVAAEQAGETLSYEVIREGCT